MQRLLVGLLVLIIAGLAVAYAVVPGMLESGTNKVVPHDPYAVSPAGQAVHDRLVLADLHADSLLWKRNILDRGERGHVDIPRLLEGGFVFQVFSAVTKSPSGQNYASNDADTDRITSLVMAQGWPPRTWFSLFERAVYQAQKLHRFTERSNGALRVIRTRGDLARLRTDQAQGRAVIGGLLAIEGAHALEGRLDAIDGLWDAGYRMMGLHHFFDNGLGGSLHGLEKGGLSAFGRQAVTRMAEKGVILDLAHSSEAVVRDVLDMGVRGLVISHTGFKGHCNQPRNISDDLMQRFAQAGGLIGVGYWDGAVCDPSPGSVAAAIAYGVALVGADQVALGSDYDGATTVAFDASEMAVLTDALLAQGLDETTIEKVMGGNTLAFMDQHLPN
ncbi:MAG: dipeptidase [Alphaproteobacteria bacterium]